MINTYCTSRIYRMRSLITAGERTPIYRLAYLINLFQYPNFKVEYSLRINLERVYWDSVTLSTLRANISIRTVVPEWCKYRAVSGTQAQDFFDLCAIE